MASKTFAISRAIGVIGATAVLATGVTFAALTSNVATLSNNSIADTTAQLSVYDAPSNSFLTSGQGFTVTDLVPGFTSSAKPFYLKNSGNLDLKISVNSTVPANYSGLTNWADLKVNILDTYHGGVTHTTMAALIGGNVPLDTSPLVAGAQGDNSNNVAGNYAVTFEIDADKVSGTTLGVGNFNLNFFGEQPTAPAAPVEVVSAN